MSTRSATPFLTERDIVVTFDQTRINTLPFWQDLDEIERQAALMFAASIANLAVNNARLAQEQSHGR